MLIQPEIVISLKKLVAELSERHSLTRLVGKAFLHGVLRHHVVDSDVLTDVADEIEEGISLHPVIVVDKLSLVGSIGIEVENLGELGTDTLDIVKEGLLIEKLALLGLHRRVTDHAGGSADQGDRLVTALLEMPQYHYADKMADVQGVSRRVDSDISGLRTFHKFLLSPGHDVLDHASPSQFLNEILHRMNMFSY